MAVVPMQKVAILAHRPLREDLIDLLQKHEVLEISEAKPTQKIDHTEVRFREADLTFAIATLKEYASKETLRAMEKPSTTQDVLHAATHTDVLCMVEQLRSMEKEDTKAEGTVAETQNLITLLTPWTSLSYNLNDSRVSDHARLLFGTISSRQLPLLKEALKGQRLRTEISEISSVENGATFLAVCLWKKDAPAFEMIATTHGWTEILLPQEDGFPAALLEEERTRCLRAIDIKKKNRKEREKVSVELPKLKNVRIFLDWLDEKRHAREAMTETLDTVMLIGWVPRGEVVPLERTLHQFSSATAIMRIKPDAGEEPPVLLRNPGYITPFESVTNLYGLPLYRERDPTFSLAPFFALYFALCLTDAGYGLILASVFGGILAKTKKSADDAPLVWTLCIGGILTFFVGTLFGGWFGLSPEQVPAFLTKQIDDGTLFFRGQFWNLGHQSGITFLQYLSLALGIAHICFGMFLAGWHKWIHGKKAEAIWINFTNHLLIGTGLLYMLIANRFTLIPLLAALLLFIWGKGYGSPWYLRPAAGLFGLINFVISMLSNTLSYLRILALGLVTGALAMAVNMVAVEIGGLFPVIFALPLIAIIFVIGHTVSIALNTLGSFIHSGRLQFIEFFSQFFEGGGRAFSPLKRSFI